MAVMYAYMKERSRPEDTKKVRRLFKDRYGISLKDVIVEPADSMEKLLEIKDNLQKDDELYIVSLWDITTSVKIAIDFRIELAMRGIRLFSLYDNLNEESEKALEYSIRGVMRGMLKAENETKYSKRAARQGKLNRSKREEDLVWDMSMSESEFIEFMLDDSWNFKNVREVSKFTGLSEPYIRDVIRRLKYRRNLKWNEREFRFEKVSNDNRGQTDSKE